MTRNTKIRASKLVPPGVRVAPRLANPRYPAPYETPVNIQSHIRARSEHLQIELDAVADAIIFERQRVLERSLALTFQQDLMGLSTDASSNLGFE